MGLLNRAQGALAGVSLGISNALGELSAPAKVAGALALGASATQAAVVAQFDTIGSNPAAAGANPVTVASFAVNPASSGRLPLVDVAVNQTVHIESFTVLGGVPGISQADLAGTNWKLFVGQGISLSNLSGLGAAAMSHNPATDSFYPATISVSPVVGGTYTSGGSSHQLYSITGTFNQLITLNAGQYALGFFEDIFGGTRGTNFLLATSTGNFSNSNGSVSFGESYVVQGSDHNGDGLFDISKVTNFPDPYQSAMKINFSAPEPGTTLLAGIGLAALAFRRNRKGENS